MGHCAFFDVDFDTLDEVLRVGVLDAAECDGFAGCEFSSKLSSFNGNSGSSVGAVPDGLL